MHKADRMCMFWVGRSYARKGGRDNCEIKCMLTSCFLASCCRSSQPTGSTVLLETVGIANIGLASRVHRRRLVLERKTMLDFGVQ
jgi:hypothetical protein